MRQISLLRPLLSFDFCSFPCLLHWFFSLLGTEIELACDDPNEDELHYIYTHPEGRMGLFQGRLVQVGSTWSCGDKIDNFDSNKIIFLASFKSPNGTWLKYNRLTHDKYSFTSINPRSMKNMFDLNTNLTWAWNLCLKIKNYFSSFAFHMNYIMT